MAQLCADRLARLMIATPDIHESWPEADDPEAAALREAVSVALGLIISFTPHEGEQRLTSARLWRARSGTTGSTERRRTKMGKQSKSEERPTERSVVPTVADAEQAIAALERDRAALATARAQDDAEMQKHAYAARVQHEAGAVRVLNEIAERAIEHDQRLREVDAAMVTAKSVLAEARQAEHAKAERAKAGELKAAIDRMKLAGQTLDDALIVLVEAGAELHVAVDQIHECGVSHPHHQQVLSLGERALVTALQQTIWARAFHVLAPREQTRFSDFISQWERMLQNEIARRLGEKQNEEAA
jgi:hypothetical protein